MALLYVRCSLIFVFVFIVVQGSWISMSHVYDNLTLVWGSSPPFEHKPLFEGRLNDNVPYVLTYSISLSEHTGTHIDAPIHMSKGKWTLDQIPPEKLIGRPIVVVNITEKSSKDRNALLTVADIEEWEERHGRIPDDSVLLVHTGWDKYWPDAEKYLGTKTKNASLYRFPGTC